MTIESKEKALPGYKSLAEVQKATLAIQEELLIEQRITNYLLWGINEKKDRQYENDSSQYAKWEWQKKKDGRISLLVLMLAIAALSIDIARDDSIAVGIAQSLKGLIL